MANLTKRRKRVERCVLAAIEQCASLVEECPTEAAAARSARELSSVLPNLTWLKEDA